MTRIAVAPIKKGEDDEFDVCGGEIVWCEEKTLPGR